MTVTNSDKRTRQYNCSRNGNYMLQDSPNLKELDKQDKDVTILIKRLECALELKISKGPIYLRLKELNFEIVSLRRQYSFEIRVSFLYIV